MSAHSQEFCVRWNSHLGSLGAAFPQLLAGQRFVDVTLACEGHQLHCHRLVLAACSSYFESILAENPCKHPVIILPRDIKLWEIQALVDFMYKGEVNVTQAGLPNLLKCAESLRIRGLYGSDAALNLNQLRQMAKAARTATVSAPSHTAQQQAATTMSENSECNDEGQGAESAERKPMSITQEPTITAANGPLEGNSHLLENQDLVSGNINEIPMSNNSSTTTSSNCSSTNTVTPAVTNQPVALNVVDQSNFLNQSIIMKCESVANEPFDDSNIAYDHFEDYPKPLVESPEDDSYAAVNDEDSFNGENDESALQMSLDSPNNSYKRVRRSEASLAQAAKCVSKGQTFQTVSNMFNIPVSTIRFYMARKGILPKRKRGRGSSSSAVMTNAMMTHTLDHMKRSSSPSAEPPFQFVGYKLPAQKPNLI